MKLFKNFLITKKFKRSVIAIGNFDGLHLGHNKVINRKQKLSKIKKTKFGILTFEPVPVMFFNQELKTIEFFL